MEIRRSAVRSGRPRTAGASVSYSEEPGAERPSEFCIIAAGITYSRRPSGAAETSTNKYDTPQTVLQIEAHNRKVLELCR